MGKGMAGLAWQHDKPIQTCNLKEDSSGQVRPGAKAVDAQGAVAVREDDDAETLAARVLEVEHRIYPMALGLVAAGRVRVVGGRCVDTQPRVKSSTFFR